jgi:hypothetical protein
MTASPSDRPLDPLDGKGSGDESQRRAEQLEGVGGDPLDLVRGSGTERAAGAALPFEAVQISSASSLTRSELSRRTRRPAQCTSGW